MKEKEIDVRYLNRDFDSIKEKLIEFTQVYYPDTFNDFSEESPGTVFIDMASYAADVLSFYTDVQFKEGLLQYAEERENIVGLAANLGYRVKPVVPSLVTLDVFIVVPATENNDGDIIPDDTLIPIIEEGMIVTSDSTDAQFITREEIDFTEDSERSPREVRIFEFDTDTGDPAFYLLKKHVQAVAGTQRTRDFTFDQPERYTQIRLPEDNVIDIVEVIDSDENRWTEVPYLAQDVVFEEFKNTLELDPEFGEFRDEVPFMLNLRRTPRRFTRRTLSDNSTILQFGGGVSRNPNERVIPNPKNIGNPFLPSIDRINLPIDPTNFLDINTYGQVPFDTTLTVTYTVGGGVDSNVPVNDLTNIADVSFNDDDLGSLTSNQQIIVESIQDSIAVNNSEPATGGRGEERDEEIRQNAMAFYGAQNRAVTKEDYKIRALSMPERYGSVAKVTVERDEIVLRSEVSDNPLGLNLYVLGYDSNKKLQPVNPAVKQNLKTYLSQFRMLTDGVNIKNGFVINIGINFEIIVFNTFNKREVLLKCINRLKELFDTDLQNFNQPILKGQVMVELNAIDGVQNVAEFEVVNLWREEEGYSGNLYDIQSATRDGIIYPSRDPSVFEVKFPDKDIRGRAK